MQPNRQEQADFEDRLIEWAERISKKSRDEFINIPTQEEYILKSEVRKMIEKKIENLKRYQAIINVHFISVYEELLSELDKLEVVDIEKEINYAVSCSHNS